MEFRDYYAVLGVARTATQDEIKKAYRRAARRYHPDVSKEANAEEKFKEVQEAYEVLKDSQKRAAYDQLGSQWRSGEQFRPPPDWAKDFEFRGGARPGDGGRGFSDFFSSLFGGGSPFGDFGAEAAYSAADHRARIEVDLEDAFRGGTRTIELRRPRATADGHVTVETHTLKVGIPAGVSDGQHIRLSGQGEPARGSGKPGDLYLEVHIRPHGLFQLEGRDVLLTLPVAPWEAALGAQLQVPTLGGPVDMRIPPGAQAGQKLRLRARGLPGQPPGDQLVILKVVLPKADTPQAQALYEQMHRDLNFDPRANLK
jgi:curved DNA-binding protein